jgi:ribose 5-phosphate isomerase RpiB
MLTYRDIGHNLAQRAQKEYDRGVLVCGTALDMCSITGKCSFLADLLDHLRGVILWW